jgi:hypothetical protein
VNKKKAMSDGDSVIGIRIGLTFICDTVIKHAAILRTELAQTKRDMMHQVMNARQYGS